MITQEEITLPAYERGIHIITDEVLDALPELPEKGLLNIFIKHTSAGLMINENADPAVRFDFNAIMNKLIPDGEDYYTHTEEGPDDMPSHVKSAMMGNSLNIPISNGKLNLGVWQGINLCEFRTYRHERTLVLTVYS
ncbi:MAG: YjbQ family protein [Bacteroidetes bacterium]|nr:YjbQ family protein [Bacteroidota bacterium]